MPTIDPEDALASCVPAGPWAGVLGALWAQDGALDSRLGRLHAEAGLPPEVTRLRVLDVLAWSQGKNRRM